MPNPGDALKKLISENSHIKDIMTELANRLTYTQFEEASIQIVLKPDVVPNIAKLLSKEDTLVGSIFLELTPRPGVGEEVLKPIARLLEQIKNRNILVSGILPDNSFPIIFNEKISELESVEYFKQYSFMNAKISPKELIKEAAEDIWQFFLRGTKPV